METRQESYRDWLIGLVTQEMNRDDLLTSKGNKMTTNQKKIWAVALAWKEVFGAAQPVQISTIIEMLATLQGNPVAVARWFLRHADNYPEGEDADVILLAKLKVAAKKAGIQRTGMTPPKPMPLRQLPKLR